MKHLIISDLHLHHKPSWRYEQLERFCTDLQKHLQDNQYHSIILTGDMVEISNRNDNSTLSLLYRFLSICGQNHSVKWVCGQHDMHNNIPIFQFLDAGLVQMIFKEQMVRIDDIGYLSYHRDVNVMRNLLQEKHDSVVRLLYTHTPIMESIPFANNKQENLCVDDFCNYELVISGDLHKFAKFGNVQYVGSPFPRDFRDEIADNELSGGVGELNVETLEYKPLEFFESYYMKTVTNEKEWDEIQSNRKPVVVRFVGTDTIDIENECRDLDFVIDSVWMPDVVSHEDVEIVNQNQITENPGHSIEEYVDKSDVNDKESHIEAGKQYIRTDIHETKNT